ILGRDALKSSPVARISGSMAATLWVVLPVKNAERRDPLGSEFSLHPFELGRGLIEHAQQAKRQDVSPSNAPRSWGRPDAQRVRFKLLELQRTQLASGAGEASCKVGFYPVKQT